MQAALFCWRRRGGHTTRRGKAISRPQKTERDGDASSTIIRQRSVTRRKNTVQRVPEHVRCATLVDRLSVAGAAVADTQQGEGERKEKTTPSRHQKARTHTTEKETATQSHRQMNEAIAISDESIIKDGEKASSSSVSTSIRKTRHIKSP